jgi:hypothetical protein
MGEGFEQGQLTADRLSLGAFGGAAAMDQGLQGHARGHASQPFRQPRPEAAGDLVVAMEAAELLQ